MTLILATKVMWSGWDLNTQPLELQSDACAAYWALEPGTYFVVVTDWIRSVQFNHYGNYQKVLILFSQYFPRQLSFFGRSLLGQSKSDLEDPEYHCWTVPKVSWYLKFTEYYNAERLYTGIGATRCFRGFTTEGFKDPGHHFHNQALWT